MDRIARLLSASDRSSRILEIGPSYNPVAPKAAGWSTHVVDHATRDQLRAKYAAANVNLDVIEEVDTIWKDGSLQDAIPTRLHGGFDTLIASHVIEHTPDLAGFLISATRLLRRDGVIALAIPDRRYCFDYFRSPTTTGDLLEAHAARRTHHTLRTAWNHMAYSVKIGGALGWGPHPTDKPTFIDPFAAATTINSQFRDDADAPYADYHAWQFTPAGFELAILEMGQLGVIDWQIESIHGSEAFEFFAFLRRGVRHFDDPAELQALRLNLLERQLIEIRTQIEFALAGGGLTAEAASTAQVSAGQPPMGDSTARKLTEMTDLLSSHDTRLQEVEDTLSRIRAALRPIRPIWRLLHGLRSRAR